MALALTPEQEEAVLRESVKLSPADRLLLYRRLEELRIERAREDPAAFAEYILKHSKTGKPIRNAPFHVEWHRFFTENRWGVISASVEHGKTEQIGIARTIWEMGRNPSIHILLVGASDAAARKTLGAIRRHIERNPAVRKVFPNLHRSTRKGDPWNDNDIRVESESLSRDPTVQARGVGSRNILGSRIDLAIIDDLLGIENTRSQAMRDGLSEWFDDVVVTRISDDWEAKDYGRVFVIGNPWHIDDLMARLGKLPGWKTLTTAAVLNPQDPPEKWRPTWPQVWPLERLLDRRSKMLPHSFARKYLCQILDAASRRFLWAWLQHMLSLGRGRHLLANQPRENGRPMKCVTSVDPGIGKGRADAVSAIITLAVTSKNQRVLAAIQAGQWTGPELLRRGGEQAERFDSELVVEGNAAQKWLAQFGTEAGIVARAINTGSEKWDEEYGVEALAVLVKNGFFIFPSGDDGEPLDPEVAALVQEMYNFDPAEHTGDRLMALWIADKAVREYLAPRSGDGSNHMDR